MNPRPTVTPPPRLSAASLAVNRTNALMRANRNLDRLDRPAPIAPSATPGTTLPPPTRPPPHVTPTPTPTTPTPTTSAPQPVPAPVPKPGSNPLTAPLPRIPGLDASQTRNAWAVVLQGHRMGISQRGQIIAMATALQESQLINYTHAVDHDSLGIFQQRPSMGWGTPSQIEDPLYAAHAFYRVLVRYEPAWGCLTCAAQDVQRSAYPGAYAKHERFATTIVRILNRRFQSAPR